MSTHNSRAGHVWIVEMQVGRAHKQWLPCAEAALTRRDAKRLIEQEWAVNNPTDRFRVAKYVRATTDATRAGGESS